MELGERRRADHIALLISSDLARAVETARLAFPDPPFELRSDPRLRECSYGDLNGAPAAEIRARREGHRTVPFPNGESYEDVVRRTKDLLQDLRIEARPTVLLIGHSANLLALQHLLEGRDLGDLLAAEFVWRPGWEFSLR